MEAETDFKEFKLTETLSQSTSLLSSEVNADHENIIETDEPPQKKRRGRPPKSVLEGLTPTRESQRIKKCPTLMNYQDSSQMRCFWSDDDKTRFLKALKKFGPEDMKGLKSFLPNKHENEINNQIRMWKEFARIDLEKKMVLEKKKTVSATVNCITKLDEWLQHFQHLMKLSPLKSSALSNVFLLISQYGDFPPPSEYNGIDLRAMYRYIHCMLNGIPYYDLNQVSAKLLNDSISDMFTMLREHIQLGRLQSHLYQTAQKPRSVKPKFENNYSRTTYKGPKSRNPETIVNLPDVNPLNLPPSALDKCIIENNYFDNNCYTLKDCT